jgi:Cof subfamily protein (haloacid dehalogenase superfamily)
MTRLRRWWYRLRYGRSLAHVRLVVSDVDGTLVSLGESLPNSTATLLQQLRSRGIELAFASARPYPGIHRLLHSAGIAAWIISLDGALTHTPTGEVAAALGFPHPVLESILELASHYDIHYAAFTPHELLYTPRAHIPSYLDDPGLARRELQLRSTLFEHPVVLLLCSGAAPQVTGLLKALERLPRPQRRQLQFGVTESFSMPGTLLLEIRLRTAHKGTAAQFLMRRLGIAPWQVLAIGDYRNDLPLFQVSGWRVAMADAVAELRSQADWITQRPASEYGIEEVLQRLLQARR